MGAKNPKEAKSQKNAPPLEKKQSENRQNRQQAGWRKVEKKGTVVGKKKSSRGIGGGTRGTSGSARSRGFGTVLSFSA